MTDYSPASSSPRHVDRRTKLSKNRRCQNKSASPLAAELLLQILSRLEHALRSHGQTACMIASHFSTPKGIIFQKKIRKSNMALTVANLLKYFKRRYNSEQIVVLNKALRKRHVCRSIALNISFLQRCRDNGVCPSSIQNRCTRPGHIMH